jgi:hypothetical protein
MVEGSMMDRTVDKAVRDWVEYNAKPPEEIARLVSYCNTDLWSGPLYFGPDGEPCGWCEPGAQQFDFSGALETVRAWIDETLPSQLYVLTWVPEAVDDYEMLASENPCSGEMEYPEADDVMCVGTDTIGPLVVGVEVWKAL